MTSLEKHRQNTRAEAFSILTALFLAVVKGGVGMLSGSLALIATALDSVFDAVVSLVNFFTLRASAKPPDTEHPFGHGKFEAFSEFFQGVLIASSGIYLAIESIQRFFFPREILHQDIVLAVMCFSLIVTLLLVWHLISTFHKTGSLVIKADSAHYTSDILSNIGIITGLLLMRFFELYWLDALLSLLISGTLCVSAFHLLAESFHILTDHEIDKKERKKIEAILNAAKKPVSGWHLLRTRRAGTQIHIDFHLVFNEKISLKKAHDIAEKIEDDIRKVIPNAVLLVHLDPTDDAKKNVQHLS